MAWLFWVLSPVLGAAIGYATNWLAIRMLFRPRRRRWGMQGLLPRRQPELAARIGRVVGQDLVRADELLAPFKAADLRPQFSALIDKAMAKRVGDLQALPLIGAFFREENLIGFRDAAVDELVDRQGELVEELQRLAGEQVDIAGQVEAKVAAFDMARLEGLIREVAAREFSAITWWGAILGGGIGLLQAVLFACLR